ncbi:MAG: hypothetical protein IJ083_03250 [Clostridia bacterium]|nr:hypothetical protein [Clostridia bacterium]
MSTEKISRKMGQHILPSGLMRLHVSLGGVSREEEKELRRYACVERGRTITRDIIVPRNIPLRFLHFVLQRALGFQESHRHRFEIFAEDMMALTEDRMENLLNLRGVAFGQDNETESDLYAPRFYGGSFTEWLQEQYTGPYEYCGNILDDYHDLDEDKEEYEEEDRYDASTYHRPDPDDEYYVLTRLHEKKNEDLRKGDDLLQYLLGSFTPAFWIDDLPGRGEYVKYVRDPSQVFDGKFIYCKPDDPDAMSKQKVRLGDMSLRDGLTAVRENITGLIERLRIGDVLAPASDYLPYDEEGRKVHSVRGLVHPQIVTHAQIQDALRNQQQIRIRPFADMLKYVYDFGDNWQFSITASMGCSDLVEEGIISKEELDKAIEKARRRRIPVLIARDGDMLIEDCGNVPGYIQVLRRLHLDPDVVLFERSDLYDPDRNQDDKLEYDDIGINLDDDEWNDENDLDAHGMTRGELLRWALSQGWHRNDITDIALF